MSDICAHDDAYTRLLLQNLVVLCISLFLTVPRAKPQGCMSRYFIFYVLLYYSNEYHPTLHPF